MKYLPVFVYWILIILCMYDWFTHMKVAAVLSDVISMFWCLGMLFGLGVLGWRIVYWHTLELEDSGLLKTPMSNEEELGVLYLDEDDDD